MMLRLGWIAGCLVGPILAAVPGCGGAAYEYDSIVTGTVTIDGELAKTGTVAFHPVGKGRPAIGRIHPDGSYSLRTGQGDLSQPDGGTVMSGDYLVTVNVNAPPAKGAVVGEGGPPIPGPSLIASKYAQKSTTDLRFTVKPGKQVIVLNLEGAEPASPEEKANSAEAAEEAADTEPAAAREPPSAESISLPDEPPAEKTDNLESQAP